MKKKGLFFQFAFLNLKLADIRIFVEIKKDSQFLLLDNGVLAMIRPKGRKFPKIREDLSSPSDLYEVIDLPIKGHPEWEAFTFVVRDKENKNLADPAVLIEIPPSIYSTAVDIMMHQRAILGGDGVGNLLMFSEICSN